MGTEKPTADYDDKLANGVNGHSGNGTTMERSNSVQHFDGKGKDVIPLYRYRLFLAPWVPRLRFQGV